jgi:hypothetical protein
MSLFQRTIDAAGGIFMLAIGLVTGGALAFVGS